ncbi:MAG: PAS domain-containing protein [Saprospiraceae bacterium]|nr:PAS domain-containing protein [Saprospiraceae bacterium]
MAKVPQIAVVLTDPGRKIQWVNDGFTEITGYQLMEVIGKKPSLLQGPETEPEVVARIRHQLENLLPCKESITNYRKNGEAYCCKLVIYPIFDAVGNLQNYIAFEIDGSLEDDTALPILQLQKKYDNSTLRGSRAVAIYAALCDLMEQEEVYKNPDISLKELAKMLHTNTNYLSQVINQFTSQNFRQFINSHRIKAFQKAVKKKKNSGVPIYRLAIASGFKNKSSFYRIYTRFTGKKPTEF